MKNTNKEIRDIKTLVEEFSGCDHFDSKSRSPNLVNLRYTYMALCRKFTYASLEEIGSIIGDRDHSTVIAGIAKFYNRCGTEKFNRFEKIYNKISDILNKKKTKNIEMSKMKDITLSKNRNDYRARFFEFTMKQKIVVNRLKRKLEVFRHRQVFQEIALLSDEDLDDFETRAKAFLAMKRIKTK